MGMHIHFCYKNWTIHSVVVNLTDLNSRNSSRGPQNFCYLFIYIYSCDTM